MSGNPTSQVLAEQCVFFPKQNVLNSLSYILTKMGRQVAVVLYVVTMAAIIVGVDFAFFRSRFWERLTVNIGVVLVFAAFYLRFLRRS